LIAVGGEQVIVGDDLPVVAQDAEAGAIDR